MRCDKAQPWLAAWQDGEIGAWRRWQIARHVRQCQSCRVEADALACLAERLKVADPVAEHTVPLMTRLTAWPLVPACYRVLAATLLVVALSGVYTYQRQAKSASVPIANTVAVQNHQLGDVKPVSAAPQQTQPNLLPFQNRVTLPRVAKQQATRKIIVKARPVRVRSHRVPIVASHSVQSLKKQPSSAPAIAHAPSIAPREIIEVSVKITDPQQVVREYRQEIAEAERVAAMQQEYIYVVATPEVIQATGNPVPDASTMDATNIEEKP